MQDDLINPRRWWALVGLGLFVFVIQLDITIVSISLPAIQKSLLATSTQLQWLLNLVFLGLCAFMAAMGRLGDVYGLRKVLYTSGIIFAFASLGAALSPTIHWLLVFRAIQGVMMAATPVAAALVAHNFPEKLQAKAMGIFSTIFGVGLALGPVVGGIIVDTIGWRWIFFINIPIVALALLLCAFCLQEKPHTAARQSFDWVGALLLIIAMGSLIIGINQGQHWGWSSASIISCFVISALALVLFFIIESLPNKQDPLIGLRALCNRIFIAAALTSLVFGANMATLLFLDPLYLQSVLLYSATVAGFFMFIVAALTILFPPVAGWITQKHGVKYATLIVLVFTALSGLLHAFLGLSGPIWLVIFALIFFGLGWGSVNIGPVVAITATVEKHKAGVMLGALWTVFNLGTSLGLAILGMLFRYKEKATLDHQLAMPGIHLTEQQQHVVHSVLSDPEQLHHFLRGYPQQSIEKITTLFKTSFMDGFTVVMWTLFAVSVVGLIIVAFTMRSDQTKSP